MDNEKIIAGIFWLCDDNGSLEIIFDKESRAIDSDDGYITYNKQHMDAWSGLASTQFCGKYRDCDFHDFPRGRLSYDTKTNRITIHYEFALMSKLHEFKKAVEQIFGLDNPKWKAEIYYRSRCGKYN
jgi:hypothetical protein